MTRLIRVMLALAAPAALALAAPAGARDVEALAGQAVPLPLARAPARLFIADPAVATAAASAGTLFLTGRAAGTTRWSASDAAGRVIDAGALTVRSDEASLAAALAAAFPAARLRLATAGAMLIVTGRVGSAAEAEAVLRLAARYVPGADANYLLDRLQVVPAQIALQVRIAEVSRQTVKALGFNWQALGGFGNAAIGLATGNAFVPAAGGVPRGDAVDNLFASFRNGDVSLDVLIDALAQTNLVTILAEPSLTAQSGVPASFLAGGEYPIPVPQAQGVTTIEYKKFGVSLGFTATLGSDGRITLNVRPEVSQLTFNGGLVFNGTRVPALSTGRAETTVELASGQGFAIAGLLQASEDNDMRKFPLLGDVPVLGQLFRSQRFDRRETELVITVTPWLVQPVAAAALALPAPKGWQKGAATAANQAAMAVPE